MNSFVISNDLHSDILHIKAMGFVSGMCKIKLKKVVQLLIILIFLGLGILKLNIGGS